VRVRAYTCQSHIIPGAQTKKIKNYIVAGRETLTCPALTYCSPDDPRYIIIIIIANIFFLFFNFAPGMRDWQVIPHSHPLLRAGFVL
jgi:hypothetical protein